MSDGSFSVAEGELALAPGSSGWPLRGGEERRFLELFLRIDLELHGTELSISGDIQERQRRGILRRTSRRVGRFDYRVNLPGISDTEDAQASLAHGVLTVRVPRPEHAKRRRIAINPV